MMEALLPVFPVAHLGTKTLRELRDRFSQAAGQQRVAGARRFVAKTAVRGVERIDRSFGGEQRGVGLAERHWRQPLTCVGEDAPLPHGVNPSCYRILLQLVVPALEHVA